MINTLQSLRGIAIFFIFLSHCNFFEGSDFAYVYRHVFSAGGAAGVSFFIVLSGFVLTLRYHSELHDFDIQTAVLFLIRRLKKFYALHIFTLLLALPFSVHAMYKGNEYLVNFTMKLVFNLLLLQSYIPVQSVYFSFNSVAWYLSMITFLYVSFPYIISKLNKMVTGGGERCRLFWLCT